MFLLPAYFTQGCEKCKLWGKVQIEGLATALKILFEGRRITTDTPPRQQQPTTLGRNEVVALFNLLARLSESLETVRELSHTTPTTCGTPVSHSPGSEASMTSSLPDFFFPGGGNNMD